MIYLNLKPIFEAKGIDNPGYYLWKNGFTRHTSHNLLYNKTESINFKHLEKLCILLQCSPNDLFNWNNQNKLINEETHPLNIIKKEKSKGNINQKIIAIPLHKINELHNFLDNLSQSNSPQT
jgi:DNA-binding Xre family transcriptional regulator